MTKKIVAEKFNATQKALIEAAIFIADKPLNSEQLQHSFSLTRQQIKCIINALQQDYQHSGIELVEVASGYRFQAKAQFSEQLAVLFEEKAPKYSRALLETLALVAYKQPITRGEIEDIRGVAVSSHIMKTLLERQWIKILGHKEVPGRPALYGTTALFLDYFNLTSLAQLPQLTAVEMEQKFSLAIENTNTIEDS
jgi:segregation and condensation protein B